MQKQQSQSLKNARQQVQRRHPPSPRINLLGIRRTRVRALDDHDDDGGDEGQHAEGAGGLPGSIEDQRVGVAVARFEHVGSLGGEDGGPVLVGPYSEFEGDGFGRSGYVSELEEVASHGAHPHEDECRQGKARREQGEVGAMF